MNRDSHWDDDLPALDHMSDEARAELYARTRREGGDSASLQGLDLDALRTLARQQGIDTRPGLSRPELQFLLWQERCTHTGIGMCRGILEVLPEGYGFLRSSRCNFAACPSDVYVSHGQIHRLSLQSGQEVTGPARPPRRGEQFFALLRVESVDGRSLADLRQRVPFDQTMPVMPRERLRLGGAEPAVRAIELLSPWGRGHRILMHAPPGSGRTRLLALLAAAAARTNPDLAAIVCLLGERPEDVTEIRRELDPFANCQVVATTFEEPPVRHLAVADLALSRAQRLAERGQHVLLVVDSLTTLVRAAQQDAPPTGRVVVAGLETPALLRGKRLFAAARSIEGGASLTILAAIATATGSRIDEVIADEFAGKANAELVLDRELAARHVFPAIDALRTWTRREDLLLTPTACRGLLALRDELRPLSTSARLERVLAMVAAGDDPQQLLGTLGARLDG